MSIKANISKDYLEAQKQQHGKKEWRTPVRGVITGADYDNSIGYKIYQEVDGLHSADIDVRNNSIDKLFLDNDKDINTLIMCHGVTHLDWFEDIPDNKIEQIFSVNLTGSARVAQRFVQSTIKSNERKRIIMIGSMAYKTPLNGSAVYCASKAGLAMLSRCLAWELAPKGYDVFCIHPSSVEGTPMTEETINGLVRYRGMSVEDAKAYWADSPIRNRILQTYDIAALVKYLLGSDPCIGYLSGTQFELGGGQR